MAWSQRGESMEEVPYKEERGMDARREGNTRYLHVIAVVVAAIDRHTVPFHITFYLTYDYTQVKLHEPQHKDLRIQALAFRLFSLLCPRG